MAETLKIPELEVEVERAIAQVERSLAAKEEMVEEKMEIGSATKGANAEARR